MAHITRFNPLSIAPIQHKRIYLSRKHEKKKTRKLILDKVLIRKGQVTVGAAFSRDHLISRLKAVPTPIFLVNQIR
jgi:hypothetical protein